MTPAEAKTLWQQVQEESQKKKACQLHRFEKPETFKLGDYYICKSCGGKMRISDIGLYAQGFTAAGGDADIVMEGLGKTEPK